MTESTAPDLAAILVVAPEMLAQLLQLPKGAYIDSAQAPHDRPGVLELRIRGAGWPVIPGSRITKVIGKAEMVYTTALKTTDLVPEIDWGLPEATP